jgi:hypothetical protein
LTVNPQAGLLATLCSVPLHLRHINAALRGERPAGAQGSIKAGGSSRTSMRRLGRSSWTGLPPPKLCCLVAARMRLSLAGGPMPRRRIPSASL